MATLPIAKFVPVDFRRDLDLNCEDVSELLSLAARMKASPRQFRNVATGKNIALLFEKPSLRTRLTFELAIKQLGGDAVTVEGPLGVREPIKDVARNLDRWVDAIVARTFAQSTVDELANYSSVPVINALSDLYHPCQVLADLQTLQERFGGLRGLHLAYVGDGNNVAHSLMLAAGRFGMHFSIAHPEDFAPDAGISAQAQGLAEISGGSIRFSDDAHEAVTGADAVYTDVWASMGQESEAEDRKRIFAPYQVNAGLMSSAGKRALFMHCLPAKRGQEVTDDVIESKYSVVFDQAENRLHVQKALLAMILG